MNIKLKELFFKLLVDLDDFVGDLRKFYKLRFIPNHPLVDSINSYRDSINGYLVEFKSFNDDIPSSYSQLLNVSEFLVNNLFKDNCINEELYKEHIDSFEEVLDLFNDDFDISDLPNE